MNEAREVVLERIRAAIGPPLPPVEIPRDYLGALPADVDVVERFIERVADYRATVHRASAADVGRRVAAILADRGISRLIVPDGVANAWLADCVAERLSDEPPLRHDELDAADGVLTGCAVAIAETGTIVLDAGAGQGRRALTLLPDHHVCVVHATQIVGDVPEALRRLDPSRPLTWISGPSATSDIELERVEGVHGPRVLDVVVVG